MTALAGIVANRDVGDLQRICRAMLDQQRAYGRDDPSTNELNRACFGLRLTQLLPEDRFDRQPIANDQLLVADLRLDNRRELLEALGERIEAFAERADSDILMACWQRWGPACLDRIVGDYAFALFDPASQTLYLVRDPEGAKPLFYVHDNQGIRFASMPSGLAGDAPLAHNLPELASRLAGLPLALSEATSFEGVARVLPGEIVSITPTGVARRIFWQPSTKVVSLAFDEAVATMRERIDWAVEARLRSTAPIIGSQLSSGYDSSAVTGTAARMADANSRIVAFTAVPGSGLPLLMPRNRIADESMLAAKTAAMHGIEHQLVHEPASILSGLNALALRYQDGHTNVLNVGWWHATLAAANRAGAATMLHGMWGNFTISFGGIVALPYLLRSGQLLRWFNEARAIERSSTNRWRGILMASARPWMPRQADLALRRLFWGAPKPSRFRFVRHELLYRDIDSRLVAETGDLHRDQLGEMRQQDPGPGRKARLALTGVEERDPTADRRLAEFCLTLPPERLLSGGRAAPVARAALSDRVPAAVLDSRLRGYQGADWYDRFPRAEAQAMLEEIRASPAAHQLLDLDKLAAVIADWPAYDPNRYEYLFAFARHVTNALAAGLFVAQSARDPGAMGR